MHCLTVTRDGVTLHEVETLTWQEAAAWCIVYGFFEASQMIELDPKRSFEAGPSFQGYSLSYELVLP